MRTLSVLALLLALPAAKADPSLAPVFGNGMVLQRGMPVPVWGKAKPGEAVTVSFQEQKKTATADKDGQWRVVLDKLEAGGPHMLAVAGTKELAIKDVLVGEVWLCSGQSNMVWTLAKSEKAAAEAATADLPQVRFSTPRGWVACTPKAAPGFSACAYYFGRDLHRQLKVPVGLVVRAVGGTSARLWTPLDAIEQDEALAPFKKAILGDAPPKAKRRGNAGSLYAAHIKPLAGFAMRGAIWYQGESDASRAGEYAVLFPAMIRSWRKAWGQGDFPFLYVQLAPIRGRIGWAELRQAQLDALSVPNSAMAVITDSDHGIHPLKKQLPGSRLALAALAVAYGEKVVHSGPVFDSMKAVSGKAILTFKHVGGGLAARGNKLAGFALLDAAGKAHPAEARIEDGTVVLESKGVPAPAGVEYAYEATAAGTLMNKEGLPASPFRWMPAKK